MDVGDIIRTTNGRYRIEYILPNADVVAVLNTEMEIGFTTSLSRFEKEFGFSYAPVYVMKLCRYKQRGLIKRLIRR